MSKSPRTKDKKIYLLNMRKSFKLILIIVLLFPFFVFAQKTITIKGFVFDSLSNKSLSYANVIIKSTKNDSVLFGTITDTTGLFVFKNINIKDNFSINTYYLGYKNKEKEFSIENIRKNNEYNIIMQPDYKQLNSVEIVGNRKVIEIDKTSIPIDSSLLANTTNTFDLMQKIPELKTNPITNSVSIKGKENTFIMVNGVQTSKSIDIKTINPDDIERIEVIDIPSGEFENSIDGVINIIIKKNANKGMSFYSENEYAHQKNFSTYNNFQYRFKNSSLGIDYNYSNKQYLFSDNINRTIINLNSEYSKTNECISNKDINNDINIHYDYNISDNSYFSFYSANSLYKADKSFYGIINNNINNQINYYLSSSNNNKVNLISSNNTLYFKTQKTKKGMSFSVNNNFSINNGDYKLSYIDTNKIPVNEIINRTYQDNSTLYSNNMVVKLHIPINKNSKMNIGGLIYYQTFNNNYSANNKNENIKYNMYKTNIFTDFTGKIKSFSYRLGLKLENYKSYISDNTYSGYSLQPSIYLSKKITKNNQIVFSYTKKSYFPSIWQLSSPTLMVDSLSLYQSNEELKPQQKHQLKILYKYSKKYNLINISALATYYQNMIVNYYYISSNDILNTIPYNIDGKLKYSLNLNGSNIIFQLFMLDYDINLFRESFIATDDNRVNYSWKGEFTLMMAMPFGFRIGGMYNYYGKVLLNQGYYNLSPEFGLFLGKRFFDDRASFSISYMFYDSIEDYVTEQSDFNQYSQSITYEKTFLFRLSVDLFKGKEVTLKSYNKYLDIERK
jgi:hypothetical protein